MCTQPSAHVTYLYTRGEKEMLKEWKKKRKESDPTFVLAFLFALFLVYFSLLRVSSYSFSPFFSSPSYIHIHQTHPKIDLHSQTPRPSSIPEILPLYSPSLFKSTQSINPDRILAFR